MYKNVGCENSNRGWQQSYTGPRGMCTIDPKLVLIQTCYNVNMLTIIPRVTTKEN